MTHGGFLSRSQYFSRPEGTSSYYCYEALKISTLNTDFVRIASHSSFDTYGCLYNGDFNPSSPTRNLLLCDDDSGPGDQFLIMTTLQRSVSYTLVVTTFTPRISGNYQLHISSTSPISIYVYTPFSPATTGSLDFSSSMIKSKYCFRSSIKYY